MKISAPRRKQFQNFIWKFYLRQGRNFPWRESTDPYQIVVSEIMLQQTQVQRVVAKYQAFTSRWIDFMSLATASTAEVLKAWQGLGYNRRALALKKLSCIVSEQYRGQLPSDVKELEKLPGLGPATARSVATFAFNLPTVFIETNIRRVFIDYFFTDSEAVDDRQILPLVAATLDEREPRQWYWALMDYGAYLARAKPNPNRRSRHYSRQSPFEGSRRQLRGAVLRSLVALPVQTASHLAMSLTIPPEQVEQVLKELVSEGFISATANGFRLKD